MKCTNPDCGKRIVRGYRHGKASFLCDACHEDKTRRDVRNYHFNNDDPERVKQGRLPVHQRTGRYKHDKS